MNWLQIVWDVSPIIFKLGSFEIRWYGLCFALGFVIGYQIIAWAFKIEKKDSKDLDALLLTMILSIVLGARMGHYIFYEGQHFFNLKPLGRILSINTFPTGSSSVLTCSTALASLSILPASRSSRSYRGSEVGKEARSFALASKISLLYLLSNLAISSKRAALCS